tara:strand:- start:1282 stop:1518 length:237 start_codon:yes stop_codon:yes gene_type:complete
VQIIEPPNASIEDQSKKAKAQAKTQKLLRIAKYSVNLFSNTTKHSFILPKKIYLRKTLVFLVWQTAIIFKIHLKNKSL